MTHLRRPELWHKVCATILREEIPCSSLSSLNYLIMLISEKTCQNSTPPISLLRFGRINTDLCQNDTIQNLSRGLPVGIMIRACATIQLIPQQNPTSKGGATMPERPEPVVFESVQSAVESIPASLRTVFLVNLLTHTVTIDEVRAAIWQRLRDEVTEKSA